MTEQPPLTDEEIQARRERFLEAVHLQKIENNPLDEDQLAMFEMFQRERWSDEQRTDYIRQRAHAAAAAARQPE
ncbi:hypothetical protein [Pseudaestuariivita rosea]|uniref:hypothetical protein n=1 Tax=Pseudaestuariivita rosea TaxID=2763263 RepID=UPI001ABA53FA|nr:hypothetical protein [Pseudaestuariivita rosea]